MTRDELLELVFAQMEQDIDNKDYTAIEVLLKDVGDTALEAFVSEELLLDVNNTGGKW